MKNLLILVVLLNTSATFAGNERGNGGDVIVCQNGAKKSAELLDLFEGRTLRGLTYTTGAGDYLDRAQTALKQLERLDPKLGQRYLSRLPSMIAEFQQIPGIELVDVPDSNHDILPAGCKLQQIAVRRENPLPGEFRFIISKDLFDILDERNRAALVLHELVYEHLIEQFPKKEPHAIAPQNDSILARYFNSHIVSDAFSLWILSDYLGFQGKLPVTNAFYFEDLALAWGSFEFFASGKLRAAATSRFRGSVGTKYGAFRSAEHAKVEFHENGKLAHLEKAIAGNIVIKHGKLKEFPVGGEPGHSIWFDEQGDATSVRYNPRGRFWPPLVQSILPNVTEVIGDGPFQPGDGRNYAGFNGTNRFANGVLREASIRIFKHGELQFIATDGKKARIICRDSPCVYTFYFDQNANYLRHE